MLSYANDRFINCLSLGNLGDSYSKKERALLTEGSGAYRSKIQVCCTDVSLLQTQTTISLPPNNGIPENARNAVTEFDARVHLLHVTPKTEKLLPLVTKVVTTT